VFVEESGGKAEGVKGGEEEEPEPCAEPSGTYLCGVSTVAVDPPMTVLDEAKKESFCGVGTGAT